MSATPAAEPRVGCGAAIVVENRILLLQRATAPEAGCWGLPGGKVDLFETARDATSREVMEEVGLAIDPVELLCVVDQIERELATHWVAPVYLVTSVTGEPRLCEPAKHTGLAWFPLDATPPADRLTTPTRVALHALLNRLPPP